MATTVTVKVYFEAAHRLHNPAQSDDWNRRVFGKCNNPHGHGHNYVIEATVQGEPDPNSGYLIDMKDLKAVLNRAVVNHVDHRHLNIEVSWLEGIIPTMLDAGCWMLDAGCTRRYVIPPIQTSPD
jgi:6-pyruvoyltetrahydropterin/6-carboxytetrahydropterin synthase